jgi:hypothetical protein
MQKHRSRVVAEFAFAVIAALSLRAAAEPPNVAGSAPARPSASAAAATSAAPDPAALIRAQAALEAHRVRLAGGPQPHVRAKLEEPIQKTLQVAAKKTVAPSELLDTANRSVAKAFAYLSKDDAFAMALVALMEADKTTRVEVSEIKARLEAVRQAKDCRSALPCLESLSSRGGTSKEMADKGIADLKNQRDSLSELGETEAHRLRVAVDRQAKLSAALSGLLKKIANTSEAITQNIK